MENMQLLLFVCYSQKQKAVLQNCYLQGKSLRIPNQLFEASWFGGK